jgi:positive regulator of sigma E activity
MYISLKVKKSALFSALISYIDPYAWLLVKAQITTCLEREQKNTVALAADTINQIFMFKCRILAIFSQK